MALCCLIYNHWKMFPKTLIFAAGRLCNPVKWIYTVYAKQGGYALKILRIRGIFRHKNYSICAVRWCGWWLIRDNTRITIECRSRERVNSIWVNCWLNHDSIERIFHFKQIFLKQIKILFWRRWQIRISFIYF